MLIFESLGGGACKLLESLGASCVMSFKVIYFFVCPVTCSDVLEFV